MPLIARQIPALYDGISQQPPNLRLPSQAEVMVNGWSTVVQGLMKRPPTQHVAELSGNALNGAFIYIINVTSTERYILVLTQGGINVYDMQGRACTVLFTHDNGYLYPGGMNPITWRASLSGQTDFKNDVGHFVKPTTANGYIYKVVVNAGGTGGTTQPTWPTTVGQTVNDGGLTYQCYAPWSGTFNPQAHFGATMINGTTFIVNKTCSTAMEFASYDRAVPGTAPNCFYTSIGTMPGDQYSFQDGVPTAAYGSNPTPIYPGGLTWYTVQNFNYLPTLPNPAGGNFPWPSTVNSSSPSGTIYRITGDTSNSFASYFVIYENGAWQETCSPSNNQGTSGLVNTPEPLSMPWALSATTITDGNGNPEFLFQPIMWEPRRAGDDITNPNPSFMGSPINDVFAYQNRLGFCANGNVIMSQAGQYNNFFRLTATQALDDQVIDLGSSDNELTTFNFGVPFATGMMLFSDQAQVRLVQPYNGNLTYATATLNVATRFISSKTVRPVFLGTDVYFVSEDATFARLREYYVMMNYMGQYQMDAQDIAAHVPKYIPTGVTWLTGDLIHNALFMGSSAAPNLLYVYQFLFQDQQKKAQAAWHNWQFPTGSTVLYGAALDDYLWVVLVRPDGKTYLEKINLSIGANVGIADQNGQLFDLLIDRRCQVNGVFTGSSTDTTIFTLPYNIAPNETYQLIAPTGEYINMTGAVYGTNTITLPGNFAVTGAWCGVQYTFTYQFSQQFMMNQNNVAIISGRMQLRNWRVYFDQAAAFTVNVYPYGLAAGTTPVTYIPAAQTSYTGWTLGESSFTTNVPTFMSGQFEIGVFGETREAVVQLINDTPYPSIFLEAEWEGEFTNRARNV